MKKISSFTVNHDTLTLGMYISRVDGDIITYDIRMALPNAGDYLDYDGIHTFEHLFATYARNSDIKDSVIYVGPMGCRTGFYLLLRNTVTKKEAIALVQNTCDFILSFTGEIPGSKPIECGNAQGHSLKKAQEMALVLKEALKEWTVEKLRYPS